MRINRILSLICGAAAVLSAGTMSVKASDVFSREEVISIIWEDIWFGDEDDGTVFPEASFKHHILEEWVNDNYSNNEDYEWDNIGRLSYQYTDYYRDKTENWLFTDEDSQWFITDETDGMVYHFAMFQGEWNMIDANGNTVETFKPFSTIEEEEMTEEDYSDDMSAEDNNYRVSEENREAAHQKAEEWSVNNERKNTAETAAASAPVSAVRKKSDEKKSGTFPVLAGVLAVCLASGAGIIIYKSRKN